MDIIHIHGRHVFKWVILILVIFAGHQVPITAKLCSFLTTGLREDSLSLLYTYIREISNTRWQLLIYDQSNLFLFFLKSTNYHFCQTVFDFWLVVSEENNFKVSIATISYAP